MAASLMVTGEQFRMARAALRLTTREVAAIVGIDKNTLLRAEAGARGYYQTVIALQAAYEARGIEFLDPIEGVRGPGVALKWGVDLSQKPASGGTGVSADEDSQGGGASAAWDDGIDALHEETPPDADPEIEELRAYWRANSEKWAAMHKSTRWALLDEMGLREL